jgi:hypothetical protein
MTVELVKFITYRKNGLTFGKVIEGEHKDKKCFFLSLWCKREEPEKIGEGCIIERWPDHFILAGIDFGEN